jgi:diguanylate cyclase (GGDEF)-like protein
MYDSLKSNWLFWTIFRKPSLSKFNKAVSGETENDHIPVYYFREVDQKHIYVSPGLQTLFSLPMENLISKELWNKALTKLTSKPVEEFPHVYHWDGGTDSRYLRLHSPSHPGQTGALIDVTTEISSALRLRYRLDYDQLTSLYTRPAFKRKVFDMIQRAPEKTGAMLFIDLDNLKHINDSKGHSAGDLHISQMARLFSFFSFFNGVVSRISGDEFAIYLHGFDDQESARRVIHRILSTGKTSGILYVASMPEEAAELDDKLAFSIGLAWYPSDSESLSELMNLADFAMYHAKKHGKGRLVEYESMQDRKTSIHSSDSDALDHVLAEGAVNFTYQPIYDLRTGRLAAYEALLSPDPQYYKSAFDLYSAAAEHGRLCEMESMLTCKLAKTYRQFASELDEAKLLLSCLTGEICTKPRGHCQVDEDIFSRLILGVTEWKLGSFDEISVKTAVYRRMGALIAADSFGLGDLFNAFQAGLHLDYLQVDLTLLQSLCGPAEEQQILERLCADASLAGSRVLVRNVKDADLAMLRLLSVDYVQGMVPPLPTPSASPYLSA